MNKKFTCIVCPNSCVIEVKLDKGRIKDISGNLCDKGKEYVKKELFNPERGVTSTVNVDGGELRLVSVKTSKPIPKEKIMDVMDEIAKVVVEAPVSKGDILIRNVAATGTDIVATRNVPIKDKS